MRVCVSGEALDRFWTTNTQEHGQKRRHLGRHLPLFVVSYRHGPSSLSQLERFTLNSGTLRIELVVVSPLVSDKRGLALGTVHATSR